MRGRGIHGRCYSNGIGDAFYGSRFRKCQQVCRRVILTFFNVKIIEKLCSSILPEFFRQLTVLHAFAITFIRTTSTASAVDNRKKIKSATVDKNKSKQLEGKKSKRTSQGSFKLSDTGESTVEHSLLKYLLKFGKILVSSKVLYYLSKIFSCGNVFNVSVIHGFYVTQPQSNAANAQS